MNKQSLVLCAGCIIIASGSLVLAKHFFPTETKHKEENEVITYAEPITITDNDGVVNYYAPEGYRIINTEDGVICVQVTKTR